MRKAVIGFAVLVLFVGIMGVGYADPVDFVVSGSGSSVTVTDVFNLGPATLAAHLAPGLDGLSFTLADGETATIDFFVLEVSGSWGAGFSSVAATLAFLEPPGLEGSGEGTVGWGSISGFVSGGVLDWDDSSLPDFVTLPNGTVLGIDFEEGIALTCGSSVTVHAMITNYGSTMAPEPTSLLLLGVGLVGLGWMQRRR